MEQPSAPPCHCRSTLSIPKQFIAHEHTRASLLVAVRCGHISEVGGIQLIGEQNEVVATGNLHMKESGGVPIVRSHLHLMELPPKPTDLEYVVVWRVTVLPEKDRNPYDYTSPGSEEPSEMLADLSRGF